MAPANKLPTSDLRSEAKQYQRDRNHNAKWAQGFAPAPGKTCPHLVTPHLEACEECAARPRLLDRGSRHFKGQPAHKATARKAIRNEVYAASDNVTGPSDSSAEEEEWKEASTAPASDADIMYSYDAATGPGRGSDILSTAVSRAVDRYETKVTDKLVKEYEFVDCSKDNGDGYAADADEDDFEVIDHNTLR